MSVGTQSARLVNQAKPADSLSLLDDKILAMIIGQGPIERTLEALCQEIEKRNSGLICCVVLLDSDGVTLRNGAAPSLPRSYAEAIDGAQAGPRAGSCGTAIYRKAPVVVSDIATDPLWTDIRDFALVHGLRACWSTPITSQDGTILGTFAIYYPVPRGPDVQHVQIIAHATHLAAVAIERNRDRSQLRAAEDRYRTLIERLPAIAYIAELGADGPWHYVSPQIQTILGFSPSEWLENSRNWIEHIHREDREIVFAAEKQFAETRQLFQAEYRLIARDGRILWFRDEGVMLAGSENGRLMQGVMYDITDRKQLEDQLRHSQKMQAVGQLAGGVAHDFNNLLMLIHAHNERLRSHLQPGDLAHTETLEIERAISQAAALTRQLLAFSRRQLLQLRVLDLNVVLSEMATMLRRLIVENIDLEVRTDAVPRLVKADPSQLGQVILNLGVNARDAMPNGGKLTIELRSVALEQPLNAREGMIPSGRYVVLTVRDTGVGMTSDVTNHLFEPFFTTKKPGQGTGLGLAIVYGVVKQTGGWILVESEPGRGTKFAIYFSEIESDAQAKIAHGEKPAPSPMHGSETVLLVEDQEGIRNLVHESLKRSGYRVLCAADGTEALKLADQHINAIDLLVSDIIMPSLSGRELANRLAKSHPKMKVIFMSGNPDEAFQRADFGPGTVVLQKPFPLGTLLHNVRCVLDRQ
jgi:PAS domain S-box-containing protein